MDAGELPLSELSAPIYRWAYRLLQDHHDALDATQGVLVKLLAQAPSPPAPERRMAWLRRVTINHCVDLIRGRRPAVEAAREARAAAAAGGSAGEREIAREPGAEESALRVERRERIALALDDLSETQRQVLVAKVYDEETFSDIARALDISVSSAKTHYLRALRKLRDSLGPEVEERRS